MTTLILSIVLGTLFGFALNRVGATNPNNIINMLRLTDTRLMKIILFAIGLASILLFVGMALGIVDAGHMSVKASYVGVLIGGAIMGIGFAIAGYCPGTGLSAAATGRKDGWWFVGGGLVGAFAYMLSYAHIKGTGILTEIWGGKVALAMTSSQYNGLIEAIPGVMIGAGLGIAFIAIALFIPKAIR